MFGDLLGDMQAKQEALQQELSKLEVQAESGDGAVTVTANANKELLNINIDQNKVSLNDVEELEDLVLIAVNRALERAGEEQEKASKNLMNEMLPPGLGGLFGQ